MTSDDFRLPVIRRSAAALRKPALAFAGVCVILSAATFPGAAGRLSAPGVGAAALTALRGAGLLLLFAAAGKGREHIPAGALALIHLLLAGALGAICGTRGARFGVPAGAARGILIGFVLIELCYTVYYLRLWKLFARGLPSRDGGPVTPLAEVVLAAAALVVTLLNGDTAAVPSLVLTLLAGLVLAGVSRDLTAAQKER